MTVLHLVWFFTLTALFIIGIIGLGKAIEYNWSDTTWGLDIDEQWNIYTIVFHKSQEYRYKGLVLLEPKFEEISSDTLKVTDSDCSYLLNLNDKRKVNKWIEI